MKNLAHEWALKHRGDIEGTRSEFDGACIDFAGELVDATPGARLAYFGNLDNKAWKYHAAMVLNGIVHDLWMAEPKPLDLFMRHIGAIEVEYPAEEVA